jgi:hypothetical protein
VAGAASESPKCRIFALCDEIGDGCSCLFDRRVGVDPVLVVEVDVVGVEASQ